MTPRTVIHYTDSTAFGGAEVALLTLLDGLDRRHWKPVLFHHMSPGLRPLWERASRLGVRARPLAPARKASDLVRLVRAVRSEKASVFHAHLPWALRCGWGLVAAALAGVPAVIASQQLFRGISSRRQLLRQWLIGVGVDRFIAVSAEMAGSLRATPLFPARKVEIIRNAVDVRQFQKPPDDALRRTLGGDPSRPIVLTLARLDPQKGLSDLLEAAARVPDANFVLAGDGIERKRIEDAARSLGVDDRVTFLGYREDVPDLLAACDLFVLPSLYEGLPVSVLEAMAAGKPVVATEIGGTREAVSNGETGLLVSPGDPNALAGAIRSVLSDPQLARRLGEAGRQRALEEFSADRMVRKVTQVYERVLSGHSAGPFED
jgi:glycosyltransferase involved in cell wall biosynthesis